MYTGVLRAIVFPLPVALFAALAFGAWAAAPQAKSTRKSTVKSTVKVSAAKKKPAPVVHRSQQQPSADRYKEIQQALADKGYFKAEPDGNWGPASIDALKHFQHDQKLVEDGKIGSLSLIALGLGPKRDAEQPPKAAESEPKIP